ncbi:hypothetical protein CK203_008745 [Vitis vinifera]|uniref:Uncharacterized protein n=1 Tax=Vitis vinifera TaxID=29760 RepID=A0A438KDC1_VITVI|nr:hypothetical protein CK203_008745 [Vitis vinifera]
MLSGRSFSALEASQHSLRLSFSPRSVCFFSLSSKAKDDKQYYFAVSYVINSCGLSPESAISASGKLHSKTPERPDSVLTFSETMESPVPIFPNS